MTRSASNVFHSTPMFDDVELVREKPIEDSFCRFCCRLMRWTKANDPNPNCYTAICCGRQYFEIAKGEASEIE